MVQPLAPWPVSTSSSERSEVRATLKGAERINNSQNLVIVDGGRNMARCWGHPLVGVSMSLVALALLATGCFIEIKSQGLRVENRTNHSLDIRLQSDGQIRDIGSFVHAESAVNTHENACLRFGRWVALDARGSILATFNPGMRTNCSEDMTWLIE